MRKVNKKRSTSEASSKQWGSVSVSARSGKIMRALDNNKFYARTIDGVAKEVGAKRSQVVDTIKNDLALRVEIKMLRRRSGDGRLLVTTKKRFSKEASFKDKFVDVFSSKKVKIEDAK
jgi:UDP-glucose 4-epimerase